MENKWSEIIDMVEQDDKNKKDYFVELPKGIRMEKKDNGLVTFKLKNNHEFKANLTNWALGQLFRKLGMPTRYFKKLYYNKETKINDLSLVSDHVNYRTSEKEEIGFLLRARDVEPNKIVRGIVSDKYERFNNVQLVDILTKFLSTANEDFTVNQFELTEENFYVRLLSDRKRRIGKTLDDEFDELKTGVHIQNSEVGAGAIKIIPFSYRVICSNGLISYQNDKEFRQRHIWIDEDEMYDWVVNAVGKALDKSDETIELLRQSRKFEVPNPEKQIKKTVEESTLPNRYVEMIQNSFRYEPENTEFGIVNAITRTARNEEVIGTKMRLESFAGNYLRKAVA